MAIQNTNINATDFSHTVQWEGYLVGRPVVTVTVTDEIDRNLTVGSLRSQFDSFGWTQRLRTSGGPVLVLRGDERVDVVTSRYEPGCKALVDVIKPTTVFGGTWGTAEPDREYDGYFDGYEVMVKNWRLKQKDKEPFLDSWQWYSGKARRGEATFRVEVGSITDEDRIKELSSRFRLPDERIYLVPKGNERDEFIDNLRSSVELAKRNGWRVTADPTTAIKEEE